MWPTFISLAGLIRTRAAAVFLQRLAQRAAGRSPVQARSSVRPVEGANRRQYPLRVVSVSTSTKPVKPGAGADARHPAGGSPSRAPRPGRGFAPAKDSRPRPALPGSGEIRATVDGWLGRDADERSAHSRCAMMTNHEHYLHLARTDAARPPNSPSTSRNCFRLAAGRHRESGPSTGLRTASGRVE